MKRSGAQISSKLINYRPFRHIIPVRKQQGRYRGQMSVDRAGACLISVQWFLFPFWMLIVMLVITAESPAQYLICLWHWKVPEEELTVLKPFVFNMTFSWHQQHQYIDSYSTLVDVTLNLSNSCWHTAEWLRLENSFIIHFNTSLNYEFFKIHWYTVQCLTLISSNLTNQNLRMISRMKLHGRIFKSLPTLHPKWYLNSTSARGSTTD